MNTNTEAINPDLATIALENVEGFAFERFSQDFLSSLEGRSFVPLGGTQDGGADGIYDCGDNRAYYQFTKQENHRDKIRKTVRRLHEFKREFKTLYYFTSRTIQHIDKEEDLLTDELGVVIKIRDRKYIISHINDSTGTINAYNIHLSVYTQFLSSLTSRDTSFVSPHVSDPTAFVFLQHETTNRLGDRKLIHSLTDTMILWSLSETDPENNIFMTEEEIHHKIFQKFPWTKKLIKRHIKDRLEVLRTKGVSDREIRWYKKHKNYCLPYETREAIKNENKNDESLKVKFIEELKLISSEIFDSDDGQYQVIAELCNKVIHSIFEKQGLLFAHFISSTDEHDAPLVVADCIDDVLTKSGISTSSVERYRDYIESVVRKVLYHSSPNQREYLINLSRTYILLFTLQAEPKIIEYFSNMSAAFNLFLGSDILVKALSERYLDKEDQVARNLLKMASATGISMYLSECVLEEVYTHIRGTYYEFINYFSEIEPYVTREIARNSDKILIRSYFYAKLEGKISSWKSYLEQFITYSHVQDQDGKEELRKYLLSEYNLRFIENQELESVCNIDEVNTLAESLFSKDDKENQELAYNSALLVHGVYGLRRKNKESGTASEFGLKTWWLTNQRRVLKHTSDVVRKNRSQYIMRPEYILNFIAMSPNCEEVRRSFKNIFPSNFAIQLGHRLKDNIFRKILSDVHQWKNYEPGRITALMSELTDKLKTDRLKRYEQTMDEEPF